MVDANSRILTKVQERYSRYDTVNKMSDYFEIASHFHRLSLLFG